MILVSWHWHTTTLLWLLNFGCSRPTGFSGVKRDQRSTLSRRRAHIDICDSDAALKDAYPETLNFYTTPPSCSITLEEFEKYALERLKRKSWISVWWGFYWSEIWLILYFLELVLRTIERVNLSFEVRNGHEYFDAIRKELKPNEMPVYHILVSPYHSTTIIIINQYELYHWHVINLIKAWFSVLI